MLLLKAWLETRWRLVSIGLPLGWLALQYPGTPASVPFLLLFLGLLLVCNAVLLAGSGVRSQGPIQFPQEGLGGSTQFTIALPVSRFRLLSVRAGLGLLEAYGMILLVAGLAWGLFPAVRQAVAPADYGRLLLACLVFTILPYYAHVLLMTFLGEPFSLLLSGWSVALLLWGLHQLPPALDVVRAFGAESPLITHRLPWSQLGTSFGLAALLFVLTAWIIERSEY